MERQDILQTRRSNSKVRVSAYLGETMPTSFMITQIILPYHSEGYEVFKGKNINSALSSLVSMPPLSQELLIQEQMQTHQA